MSKGRRLVLACASKTSRAVDPYSANEQESATSYLVDNNSAQKSISGLLKCGLQSARPLLHYNTFFQTFNPIVKFLLLFGI